MPEGPEIRRAADRLNKVLAGQQTTRFYFFHQHLKPYEKLLQGAHVVSVTSSAKAMLTSFDCDLTIYSHNQLYGRWYISRRNKPLATKRSLRLEISTDEASALLYSASDIEVLSSNELGAHPFLNKLGPDALNPNVTVDAILAQLTNPTFRKRALASLLLDQSFVAGLGNYLRSEILYYARVHPAQKPQQLSETVQHVLAELILEVTRRSYRTAGITNLQDQVTTLKSQGRTRKEFRFAVFGRTGQPCYTCNTSIERCEMNARRIYICPTCQVRR